jgi:hypothetical protein
MHVIHLDIYFHENPWIAVKYFAENKWENYWSDIPMPEHESAVSESIWIANDGSVSFSVGMEAANGSSEQLLFHLSVELSLDDALLPSCAPHKLPNLQCACLRDMLQINEGATVRCGGKDGRAPRPYTFTVLLQLYYVYVSVQCSAVQCSADIHTHPSKEWLID